MVKVVKLIDIWDRIYFYPNKLVYYDMSKNIEDTINTKDDMDKFVFDNRFRGLKDFEFNQDMWDKGIVLTITLY